MLPPNNLRRLLKQTSQPILVIVRDFPLLTDQLDGSSSLDYGSDCGRINSTMHPRICHCRHVAHRAALLVACISVAGCTQLNEFVGNRGKLAAPSSVSAIPAGWSQEATSVDPVASQTARRSVVVKELTNLEPPRRFTTLHAGYQRISDAPREETDEILPTAFEASAPGEPHETLDLISGGYVPLGADLEEIGCGNSPYLDPHSDCSGLLCKRYTFREDLKEFFPALRDDTRSLLTWENALFLGAAAGVAITFRQDLGRKVRENTARHPDRWGGTSETLGKFGDLPIQIPTLAGLYGYSLWKQDDELHSLSGSLISSYTITGVTTVLIKAAVNTDRPTKEWNGGEFGFPSFHTASSFTIASVLDEYYGPKAGLPAYAFAGLIGWSRIDERAHDLSDVVFGAALGYVIGKTVSRRHLAIDSSMQLLPYVHPTDGTAGVMLEQRF